MKLAELDKHFKIYNCGYKVVLYTGSQTYGHGTEGEDCTTILTEKDSDGKEMSAMLFDFIMGNNINLKKEQITSFNKGGGNKEKKHG